ncbi:MAG TPA: LarC family nickel insertion protein, partial [Kofleriaceae bacterium]|nr:LarC family nickel insertion protein [Kofleriaceae bacterium]
GAIDSIVDIVGAAAALDWLAPTGVSADAVVMGEGMVKTAHGMLPVPSPAALEILKQAGGKMVGGGVRRELCTPTGAAILAASVTRWGGAPAMTPLATGYGAGDAELEDRPNVVRATVGDIETGGDEIYRIEANVDDMNPEMCEHAAEALFSAGAVDVWWAPITMKKSRPAVMLGALAAPAALEPVLAAILRETTTIGVRYDRVARRILDRELVDVDTPYGPVTIKVGRLAGEVVNAAPEYQACRRAAQAAGVPLKRVYAAALAAYENGKLRGA